MFPQFSFLPILPSFSIYPDFLQISPRSASVTRYGITHLHHFSILLLTALPFSVSLHSSFSSLLLFFFLEQQDAISGEKDHPKP